MDHEYLLQIGVLGSPCLEWHHQPLNIPRRQVRALVYRLAVSTTPVSYDHLCYLFWPDQMQTVARRRLTHLLSHLHTALPDNSLFITTRDTIMLNEDLIWSDTAAFQRLLNSSPKTKATPDLLNAYGLYRGKFLDGFTTGNSRTLDDWIQQQQVHYERMFLLLLETLIDRSMEIQDIDMAIGYCHTYLEINNLAEDIHRRLIEFYVQKGDHSSAQKHFETYATLMYVELGEELLPEAISALDKRFKKPQSKDVKPSLYTSIPFIEREAELRKLLAIYSLVQTGKSLVCFIRGESGIGKSRLIGEFLSQVTGKVLHTQCYAGTQKMPYYPLLSLFTHQDRLHAPTHNLLVQTMNNVYHNDVGSVLQQVIDAELIRMRIYPAIENLCLKQIKGNQTLVICLEDAQWADQATLNWLAYFSYAVQDQRVLILVSYCCSGNDDLLDLYHKLHQMNISLEEIHLHGLNQNAAGELLSHIIDKNQPPEVEQVHELCRLTGGNPFYLLEIGYNFVMNGYSYPPLHQKFVPPSLEHALDKRLDGLETMAHQVLEAIAVRNAPCSFDDLLHLTRQTEAVIAEAIEQLLDSFLIVKKSRGYQFCHTLMRNRVQQRMKPIHKEILTRRIKRLCYPANSQFTFVDLLTDET